MASTASQYTTLKKKAPRLFIVISTGQNIANIIPILEIGYPTMDQVIWLESPRAVSSEWSDPAIKILEKYGFKNQKRHALKGDGPKDFTEAARSLLKNRGTTPKTQPIFVANGGTKTQALAAYLDRSLPIIYNCDQPCAYELFPQGIERPSTLMPYTDHRLDINDILYLRGMEQLPSPDTQCVLGSDVKPLRRTRYGSDTKYTVSFHDYVTERALLQQGAHSKTLKETANTLKKMDWSDFYQYAPGAVSRLQNAHKNRFRRYTITNSLLAHLFSCWRKALEEVLMARSSQMCQNGLNLNHKKIYGKKNIGSEFEHAVALRLVDFLKANPQYQKIIHSAWKNMKIGRKGTNMSTIECDLLIALKNGILIHLECKSSHAQAKDLDARLLNLQQSASQLAKMAICSPCYTSFTQRPWFEKHHTFKMKVEHMPTFVHIPFDLPNQPREYRLGRTTYTCHTFEEALGHFLDRWARLPKS